MSLYGLSSFKLFWNPSTDTNATLAWNGDTTVLAFRGTASLTNACSDLQVCCSQQRWEVGTSRLQGWCPAVMTGMIGLFGLAPAPCSLWLSSD